MELLPQLEKETALRHLVLSIKEAMAADDIIVGIKIDFTNSEIRYSDWMIESPIRDGPARDYKSAEEAFSILRTAVYGDQTWTATTQYVESPVPFRADSNKFAIARRFRTFIFRPTNRLGKATCFALLATKSKSEELAVKLRQLINALAYKCATEIIDESIVVANHALRVSRTKYEATEQLHNLKKLSAQAAMTPHVTYWARGAGGSILKRTFDEIGIRSDLLSADRFVKELDDDSFLTLTRLRDESRRDLVSKNMFALCQKNNWQSLVLRAISINAELAGVFLAAYQTPIVPREVIKILLNSIDHLLTDYLFNDFSMEESQQQIERLRSSQPLIFAGLQSSLKIHDGIPLLGNVQLALERVSKSLILEDQKPEIDEIRKDIAEVHESLQSAMKIADFSRLSFDEISVSDCIAKAADWEERRLHDADIEFENTVDKEVIVYADQDAFDQVFLNLISNSVYFLSRSALMERPKIKFYAVANKSHVDIFMVDNGPGVREGLHEKIFEFLYTEKKIGEGTGVGLSVSRLIVEHHRGTLESLPKKNGAMFRLTLPVVTA